MSLLPVLLRQHRARAGLTQKGLAERIHFSHTVVSRTEQTGGHYLPSENYLTAFTKELNLTEAEAAEVWRAFRGTASPTGAKPLQAQPTEPVSLRPKRIGGAIGVGAGLMVVILLLGLLSGSVGTDSAQQYRRAAEGALLYKSSFAQGGLDDWKNLNNGHWDVFNVDGGFALGVRDQDPDAVPNAYLLSSEEWTDYTFSLDVVFEAGVYEQIYLVVRGLRQPNCTGYRVGGNRLGVSIFRFDPVNGCDGEVLAENLHFPLESGRKYQMTVQAVGDRIRYWIDGRLILEAQDATYRQGGVGLLAYEVKSAYFENLVVRKTTVLR